MDRLLREGIPEEDRIPSEVAEIEITVEEVVEPDIMRFRSNLYQKLLESPNEVVDVKAKEMSYLERVKAEGPKE
jgi:hypothetical protein